ncbi:MAG: DUF1684 domain-containing protein [Acidobacteria bacterium]|nr:DUF1684 domain-containing protein [Acidobacteriota bacterium]
MPCHATLAVLLAGWPGPKEDFLADHARWKQARESRLSAPDGWLAVVGLHWLAPGENPFGSDPGAAIPLPGSGLPARGGSLVLEGGKVRLSLLPGVALAQGGAPAREGVLRTDRDGKADLFESGSVTFHVIQRGERFAVRVKDSETPARKSFKGVPQWTPDPAWRVSGSFVPYPKPRRVDIPTVLGTTEPMQAPGVVHFRLKGRDHSLMPVQDRPGGDFFFIFKDRTSGGDSYPAGRFLYAAPPKDGKVVLDFNRAINPPCAFTEFATCPLPPPQNGLKVRIEAGEKKVGSH